MKAAISMVVFSGLSPIFCQVPPGKSSTTQPPSWKRVVREENAKCVVFIHASYTLANGIPDFSEVLVL